MIVNDQVIKTKAEPFTYKWKRLPEAIVQQAKDTLPLPCDPSDVKSSLHYCSPQKEVVSKGYVNLIGMEFLVMYRYHTIEGLPWEAYLTLFRQSNGKVVPINTSQVYKMSN
ncbi:hypothetical protein BP422_20115 [Brevibacillus formosus]|uniref:Uncharacterized protein n=1 Tax=Brevibacillus formosus TaxID=54913 RepID=A0A220MLH8_9BACL|nr:hypothetical protein BP422_20115 [Brevibacillus formosus]